ncbi:MAG: class I SAM-dependent methyltransferase [Deltaproteobacteria bacterium]|nr:MAG: class I SAM-dependent methyltransferase [Deltaproteobacteria bacterium]
MLSYDKEMINMRLEILQRYSFGRTVLDLCCGTGSYLLHYLEKYPLAVGVDFSRNMLTILKKKLGGEVPTNLLLLECDAQQIGLQSESMDFVFSFTSLYYVPRVGEALAEINRVLKPGGVAAFELGNLWSLNTYVCEIENRKRGVAKSFHVPYRAILKMIQAANLTILEHRVFQILPMWGRGVLWLRPLIDWRWKWLMGIKVAGRMIDEWISGLWPLRLLAFRHLFVCQKTA